MGFQSILASQALKNSTRDDNYYVLTFYENIKKRFLETKYIIQRV